jgi:hypothetical protein
VKSVVYYENEFGTNYGEPEECKFYKALRYQVCNDDVHRNQKWVSAMSMFYLSMLPRLHRLFTSKHMTGQMMWHYLYLLIKEILFFGVAFF